MSRIAHIGGDDFFVGLTDFAFEDVFKLTLDVQNEFEYSAKNLYSKEDKEIGYIVSKDRFGTTRNFNLLSVSCSIIEINSQSNILNFDDTLNSMKKESKISKEPVYKVL